METDLEDEMIVDNVSMIELLEQLEELGVDTVVLLETYDRSVPLVDVLKARIEFLGGLWGSVLQ